MKTALVLGGAGFLGRSLVARLLKSDHEVFVIDQDNAIRIQLPGSLHEYPGRFEEWRASWWTNTFSRSTDWPRQFDFVFHLAATLTKHNIEERANLGLNAFRDIELDYSVAEYLAACPPRERAVWLSSSATDTYATENYSFVKFVGERFARTLAKRVPISILKPFGGYGPGQSLNYPLPAIMQRALNREDPLTVWGSAMTTRDWIFIEDLIDAILLSTTKDFPVGVPIEIGTGIGTTFHDLSRMLAKAAGYDPEIRIDPSKPTASKHRVANTEAAEALGFKAKVSLEEGVKRCLAYALEQREVPA